VPPKKREREREISKDVYNETMGIPFWSFHKDTISTVHRSSRNKEGLKELCKESIISESALTTYIYNRKHLEISNSFVLFCFHCAGDQTQGIVHVSKLPSHWLITLAQEVSIKNWNTEFATDTGSLLGQIYILRSLIARQRI
jgi:hypothetical protein